MRVSMKLYGQLYWYVQKQKELVIETKANTIKDIIDQLKIPIGEVSFVTMDGIKVELDTLPQNKAVIEVYPVIGGG